ncbi:MAG: LD-carboxypeptidase [Bacilli bacterium]|nr:LD-carboxypeptidase [Bacilli bacterium]
MRKPAYLQKGDVVRFVAPSFGVTTEPYMSRYARAYKNWKRFGYNVEEGPNVHLNDGVAASSSPEERAKEIMEAFSSDASLILSVGGGETMCEILPYIDFAKLKELPPKWFMGYSDNTNLTFPLTVLCNTLAVYGPCATQFFQKEPRLSEKDALRLLQGEKDFEGYPLYSKTKNNPLRPFLPYRLSKKKIITPINYEEPMKGTLLGGCLDCLITLCGTKYDEVRRFNAEHKEGVIWFLEACDLSPLGIRRALFQLKEAGWFDNAKGFLFGRPLCIEGEMMGVDHINAVTDILSDLGKPILLDVDLGHIPPMLPIISGAKAVASYQNENIYLHYEG